MIGVSVTALNRPTPLRPLEKAALMGEVAVRYGHTRWIARARPLDEVVATVRGAHRGVADVPPVMAARLARAVYRVLSPGPWDSRCLDRSLVLVGMLAARGVRSTLVIGVRTGELLAAHAWVEVNGAPVTSPLGYDRLVAL